MDRLLLHDSHNEVELNWTWLLSCPRRSETFCFKFIISASTAATSSRSALVYYQHKEKKNLKWWKTLSTSIARFRKDTLVSIVEGKDTCPLRIFISPDSREALKLLSFSSWSRKFSTCWMCKMKIFLLNREKKQNIASTTKQFPKHVNTT